MITIRNCPSHPQCLQTWDALIEMSDPNRRFCDLCQQVVQLCHSPDELQTAMMANQCVAVLLAPVGDSVPSIRPQHAQDE